VNDQVGTVDDELGDLARRAIGPRAGSTGTLSAFEPIAGDKQALSRLCERLQGPVYRLAARMLGAGPDAEDATQEILTQAITRLSTFEGRSALLTWVFTIAARHLMRARVRSRETALSPEALADKLDQGLAFAAHATDLNQTDAPVLERELQLECVQGMLFVLSRPERLAYILGDILGASDRVGADICDVTPEAFRQRLARARAELRPLLAERCGLADERFPCRCSTQARAATAAGIIRPDRLRLAKREVEIDPALARADEELGALRRMGRVFDRTAPLAPPRELWTKLVQSFPELLR
jgi:RNA polymerase sigma factor (sigma-70 family)